MDISGLKSLLRKKSDRQYGQGDKGFYRKDFNVLVDKKLILRIKLMAAELETPLYPLVEHLLELGLAEVGVEIQDAALETELKQHLFRDHLMSDKVKPSKTASARVRRIESALEFLHLYEIGGVKPQEIKDALDKLEKEAKEKQKN